VVTLGAIWKMGEDLDPHWPVEQEGYDIRIEGEPSVRVTWAMPTPAPSAREPLYIGGALTATAMSVVNAIPQLCAGPPGIRTFLDIPLISARGRYHPA
jgi:hypothetical protein